MEDYDCIVIFKRLILSLVFISYYFNNLFYSAQQINRNESFGIPIHQYYGENYNSFSFGKKNQLKIKKYNSKEEKLTNNKKKREKRGHIKKILKGNSYESNLPASKHQEYDSTNTTKCSRFSSILRGQTARIDKLRRSFTQDSNKTSYISFLHKNFNIVRKDDSRYLERAMIFRRQAQSNQNSPEAKHPISQFNGKKQSSRGTESDFQYIDKYLGMNSSNISLSQVKSDEKDILIEKLKYELSEKNKTIDELMNEKRSLQSLNSFLLRSIPHKEESPKMILGNLKRQIVYKDQGREEHKSSEEHDYEILIEEIDDSFQESNNFLENLDPDQTNKNQDNSFHYEKIECSMKSGPPNPTIQYEFSQASDEESISGAMKAQKDKWVFTKEEKKRLLEIAEINRNNPTLMAQKFNKFLKESRKHSRGEKEIVNADIPKILKIINFEQPNKVKKKATKQIVVHSKKLEFFLRRFGNNIMYQKSENGDINQIIDAQVNQCMSSINGEGTRYAVNKEEDKEQTEYLSQINNDQDEKSMRLGPLQKSGTINEGSNGLKKQITIQNQPIHKILTEKEKDQNIHPNNLGEREDRSGTLSSKGHFQANLKSKNDNSNKSDNLQMFVDEQGYRD
ncbi:unnamed protein product [Moneuplotes crassus]|uniref:Uncharacterized protein n=1 Tax=Euplotes crassus TaxID=5936 RepID=A0AAD2D1U6_EUPCR|nr:unnamed protein product [Moneuplotes crassus]